MDCDIFLSDWTIEMEHFLDTVETIGPGLGFSLFSPLHLLWLVIFLLTTLICCHFYQRSQRQDVWRKWMAGLLLADELFKHVCLLAGGNFLLKYLPLHLCSINIFLIALHAWKPQRLLGHFLYLVCIPASIAALLFPTWSSLPPSNFMHIHSFTVHILLALYPIVLTSGGNIRPSPRQFPKALLLLVGLAIPIYLFNLLFDENFMFLMYPEPGNPLYWFEQQFGSHLIGFPVLIALVFLVMCIPCAFLNTRSRQTSR